MQWQNDAMAEREACFMEVNGVCAASALPMDGGVCMERMNES